ncbi:hypothetical protein NL676_011189 [Syzygium grande]|nr:hypothetical protein NL676_011189 [Syzygium grande]
MSLSDVVRLPSSRLILQEPRSILGSSSFLGLPLFSPEEGARVQAAGKSVLVSWPCGFEILNWKTIERLSQFSISISRLCGVFLVEAVNYSLQCGSWLKINV